MKTKIMPELSDRPFNLTIEKFMKADVSDVYEAWTEKFDLWFAEPGELVMSPEIDKPFFFYNRHDWGRHGHYGRFLELEKDRLIVMTWLTGRAGTVGAETVIRIELESREKGTMLRMTHSGFDCKEAANGHKENWPLALEELEQKLN